MSDRDKYMALLTGVLLVGAVLFILPDHPPRARFKIGDCYAMNGHREVWEKGVDGMIFNAGREKYQVVRLEHLDGVIRNNHKVNVWMADFERDHSKVSCLERWGYERKRR